MNLKRTVLLSSIWSLIGNSGQPLISFLIFLYLARKLSPAEIGLVVLAMVFIEVAGFASRWGQVEVLQREPDLSDRTTSTSFWMLAAIGLATAGALALSAVPIGRIAEDGPLGVVLLLLSPIAALQAWNAVPEALLRRRFSFRTLAFRSWLATLAAGAIAVYLAHKGYGVYALVAQRLTAAFAQTIAVWFMLRWRPLLTFDKAAAKRLLGTGAEIMLAGFSNIINLRVTQGIIGFVLGPADLGLFRFGWRFFEFVTQLSVAPVSSVALATFSHTQHDRAMLTRAYLRMTQFMAIGSLPLFFGLGAVADTFIPLVFGAKWTGSVVVVQSLGLVIIAGTVNYFFAPVLIAIGRSRVVLHQSIGQVLLSVILILAGAQFNILGIIVAIVVRTWLVAAYNIYVLRRELGVKPAAILLAVLPPAVASLAMAGVVEIAESRLAGTMPDAWLLAVLVSVGAAAYPAILASGDLVGLWRGYLQGAYSSLMSAMKGRRGQVRVTPA